MGRPVKVNLNDKASDELREIANYLEIPESEVLRKGLAIMRIYAEAKKAQDSNAKLLLQEGDEARELVIL